MCNVVRDQLSKASHALGYEFNPQCITGASINIILAVALLIIGFQSNSFSPFDLGVTTVSMAGAFFFSSLVVGSFKNRKIEILLTGILSAALIATGALGIAGIITSNQLGWCILGTYGIGTLVKGGYICKSLSTFC